MADVSIVKLKVRRGTNEQRRSIVLDQGELGYTLDTRRLYVGDGASVGGRAVANLNYGPFALDSSLNIEGVEVGDIGYANNKLYILSGTNTNDTLSGYAYIGNVPGETTDFGTNNTLVVRKSSVNSSEFASELFGNGITKIGDTIAVDSSTVFFEISSEKLSIKQNTIGGREILSTSLSSGLSGGNGDPVVMHTDTSQFAFHPDNRVYIANLGTHTTKFSTFDPDSIGGGLNLNTTTNKLEGVFQEVDTSLNLSESGVLGVANGFSTNTAVASGNEFPFMNVSNGIINGMASSIYDVVTATGLSGANSGNDVPVGTILPHARAFNVIPDGYLLCDGNIYSSTEVSDYRELYDVIGNRYDTTNGLPSPGGNFFRVPQLTGGNVLLYGSDAGAPDSTTYYISGATDAAGGFNDTGSLSAQGFNFIIRYTTADGNNDLFNGAPNQVRRGYQGLYNQKVYEAMDCNGANVTLSSAGFIRFALSGDSRSDCNEPFDRFAIPVYSW
jgi:hypothetical protein|tara:strand:- start:6064 stop:7563 length:1500 start_codon:yes stop_codon:yes gene_type:complete